MLNQPVLYALSLSALIVTTFGSSLFAQEDISHVTYTVSDGLPNTYLLSLSQDRQGNLLIGHHGGGLSKFDGKDFSTAGGNKNLSIDAIFEEPDGSGIWLGARNGLYFLEGDAIRQIPTDDQKEISFVWGFMKYHHETIALTSKGAYRLSRSLATKFFFYDTKEPPFRQLIELDSGLLLASQEEVQSQGFNNIYFVDKQKIARILPLNIKKKEYLVVLKASNNELLIKAQTAIYRVKNTVTEQLFKDAFPGRYFTGSMVDSRGYLWMSTDRGEIFIVDLESQSPRILHQFNLDSDQFVSAFYEDAEKRMWAATFQGLVKMPNVHYRVFNRTLYAQMGGINNILKDTAGRLYFSANGLFQFQKNSFEGVLIKSENTKRQNLNRVTIDSWCFDDKNNLWYFSRGDNFGFVAKNMLREIANVTYPEWRPSFSISFDPYRKKVWLPANELLLADVDGTTIFKSSQGKSIDHPGLTLVTKSGQVLVATRKNELFMIDKSNKATLCKVTHMDIDKVADMREDSFENIWMSVSDGGMVKCRLKNNELIKDYDFNISHGLPSNTIESFTIDHQGRVWAATSGGLSVIEWQHVDTTGYPVVYEAREFLNLSIKNWSGSRVLTDDDNNVWVAASDKIIKIEVDKMDWKRIPPLVYLKSVQLNNEESLPIKINAEIPQQLAYDQNFLTFDFRAVSIDNQSILYSYKMSSSRRNGEHWSAPSSNHVISYNGIAPGAYQFTVKARRNDTRWGNEVTYSLIVAAPFWQTWWFISAVLCVFFLAVYGLHRFRLSQALRLERLRLRIAQDLHDDIGASLSSVSYNIEAIRRLGNGIDPKAQSILNGIDNTSVELIYSLRDMVWAINPAKDDLVSLTKKMHDYSAEVCKAKNVQLEFENGDPQDNLKLSVEVKRNLFLVLKESVNNAIKHSGCTCLKIKLSIQKKGLELEVTDNGQGFEVQETYNGNGLGNMTARSKEIHYKFEINSAPGKGTKIRMST